ncbi:hypothetical protein [Xenorhabdus bovienii]|uniref:hypothetical protein n=1 Tax=Xenorhabdus bovienii TaxID=40576 RepID=UPI003DA33002
MTNKYTYTSSKAMSDISDVIGDPLTAWKQQEGGRVYNVIFNSNVYTNTYWVERWHVPGQSSEKSSPHNAWQYVRAATAEEINAHGNPTEGTVNPTEEIPSPVLQSDRYTEETYEKVKYKPDGSGTNLSYIPQPVSVNRCITNMSVIRPNPNFLLTLPTGVNMMPV